MQGIRTMLGNKLACQEQSPINDPNAAAADGKHLQSLQHDEGGFVLHDVVTPSASHLGDAIDQTHLQSRLPLFPASRKLKAIDYLR